jgi:pyruvate/2-oxoglutarate dehydrogenase complex dihydrolipoamide dehydrogenase (E3) component
MAAYDYDIGIIGGGAAGLTVASGAAQLGARTVLIEKEPPLGGDCLHFGCVPSKTLIKSASLYHQIGRFEEYGLPAVTRPPVNFSAVRKRIEQVVSTIQHHDSVERFSGLGVDVRFGAAAFCDNHLVDTGTEKLSARKWVVATGSSPALPPLPGLSDLDVLTNREIFSLDYLPASLIIIGAGPIGVEMAQAFSRLGSGVTVLQRSSQILSREDTDMSAAVQQILEDEGVVFHLGCSMKRAYAEGSFKKIAITTAAGQDMVIEGSDILVAAGRSINVDSLKLENGGVAYSTSGIEVDGRLRSSTRNIYAAGDVVGGYQFTHAAGYEGGIVVSNAVMGLWRQARYRWMPYCTYSDPELGGMGLGEKQAAEQGIDYQIYEETLQDNDRAQAEGETAGKIKLLLDRRERILGVRVLGFHAGDLLGQWATLLNGGVKLSVAAGAVQPYPTIAEINKRVIGSVLSGKIFSDKVRTLLKIVHRYRG